MSNTLSICQDLIAFPSITPMDAGCQNYIAEYLKKLGFTIRHFPKGNVANLFAQFGTNKPLFVFAGHTDVVPVGDENSWSVPPFVGTVRDQKLYGRGVADMKGSIAAMLTATEEFLQNNPNPAGSIGFMITSAEEGDDYLDGTPYILEQLVKANIQIDYCVLGEPSSQKKTGDTLRVGRRGSLSGTLIVHGKQGHVAYPDLADNPIPRAAAILTVLSEEAWDNGNEFFPATGFQVTSISTNTNAGNVIPGYVTLRFNFRHGTASSAAQLQQRVAHLVAKITTEYELDWQVSGQPFLTHPGKLIHACQHAVQDIMDFKPKSDTGGGTSDGRFISPLGIDVVECGPCNATIHQIDECIELNELSHLHRIYLGILTRLCL